MPGGLRRFHQSGQSHFVTFSCYRRQPNFVNATVYDLFPLCLEDMRRRFELRVYGYVVMPEHVHLLLSEPEHCTLAEAIHYLKLSFAKRLRSRRQASAQVSVQKKDANLGHRHQQQGSFWQKTLLRPQRKGRAGVHGEVTIPAPEPGEARTGEGTRRLEVEQFPALCFPGERSGGNRIGVDGQGS